jgi:DNA-binding Lrp family transcriptional regulator
MTIMLSHNRKQERVMKDMELKLVSELFKDSRRSDRELAKAIGISQPTVSRTIRKLKKEGVIKEHTLIADFRKLGIELAAFTFGVWSPEQIKNYPQAERVEKAKRFLSEHPNVIFASSGQGLRMERMMVTVHKNYQDYSEFMRQAKAEWEGLVRLESFVISLDSDVVTLPFSFRNMGKYIGKIE